MNLTHNEKIKRAHAILFGWDHATLNLVELHKSRNGN
jgi:hypothetical protein